MDAVSAKSLKIGGAHCLSFNLLVKRLIEIVVIFTVNRLSPDLSVISEFSDY